MKSTILGIAIALVAGTAFAADMPVKAPPMPPPLPTWTGTYVGINGGYGWGRSNFTNTATGVTTGEFDMNGGLAGVTYGGNWQAGHVVLGFESDFDWSGMKNTGGVGAVCGVGCTTDQRWLSTERMRAGWDVNGWWFYGTGGVAFADVKANTGPCVAGTCGEKTRTGWTAGVGLETMFLPNWSAKIEYLHYDLGTDVMLGVAGGPITVLDRGDIVRAGVNYHFDMMNLLHLF